MRIVNILKIALAGVLLLGVALTKAPVPQKPKLLGSPSEKPVPRRTDISSTDTSIYVPPDIVSLTESASMIKDIRLGLRGFPARRRAVGRIRSGSPDDSVRIRDYDIATDYRVNNPTSYEQFHPSVALGSDGTIYVCWADENTSGDYGIFFAKSTDGGNSFTPRVAVDEVGTNIRPRIAVYGTGATARVYVAYTYVQDASNYDYDIYLTYSTNGGASFGYMVGISTDGYYSDVAAIAVDAADYVYVAYTYAWWSGGGCDDSDVEVDIRLAVSYNGGSSWRSTITIAGVSGHDEELPAIAVSGSGSGSTLHLGYSYDYQGDSGDDFDVHYKRITNAGSTTPSVGSDYWIAAYVSNEYVIPGGDGLRQRCSI